MSQPIKSRVVTDPSLETKYCNSCRVDKDLTEFYRRGKRVATPDRPLRLADWQAICKPCYCDKSTDENRERRRRKAMAFPPPKLPRRSLPKYVYPRKKRKADPYEHNKPEPRKD